MFIRNAQKCRGILITKFSLPEWLFILPTSCALVAWAVYSSGAEYFARLLDLQIFSVTALINANGCQT